MGVMGVRESCRRLYVSVVEKGGTDTQHRK